MNYIRQQICAFCRVDHSYFDQLERIRDWLSYRVMKKSSYPDMYKFIQENGFSYGFSHNVKCQYAIGCSKINQANHRHFVMQDEVKQLFASYVIQENYKEIDSLFRLLGGYYPREYKVLERYYYSYKKEA